MATHDDTGRLLHRVHRDLDAPMALLVAAGPQRRVVAHATFEADRLVTELLSVDTAQGRCAGTGRVGEPDFLSWAAAAVFIEDVEVGTLFVADRRRRWFDDEEVRHLGLLSYSAGPLLAAATPAIDVRERQPALASFA